MIIAENGISPVRSKSPIVIQTMDTIETTSVAERAFLVPIGHGQPAYNLLNEKKE
jgi:hypothetical protein